MVVISMTRRMWNILIVDDNTINRKLLRHAFQKTDVEVTEARTGEEAIELVRDQEFDMIFISLNMTGMNGYETTTRIRSLYPRNIHIPIIATTTKEPSRIIEKVQRYHLNDIVRKPIQKTDIITLLKKYLSFTSEDDIYSIKKANIINIQEFEKFYQDEVLRKDILETIIEEKDKDLRDIERAFSSKNCETIYHKIHYLKGSFSYIKADKILRITQSILDFCKEQMIDEVLALEEPFTENYKQLQQEIEMYLQTM